MHMVFSGVNLYSQSPERAYDFYVKLGLPVKSRPNPQSKWYGAEFSLGGEATLWIWRGGENEKTANHLVFIVNDLDEAYRAITAAGIDCAPPVVAEWGGRELMLADPDGNTVLLL